MTLSQQARKSFWEAAEAAKRQGVDLADVLDRLELLATPERVKKIRSDALWNVVEMMEQTAPQYWVGDARTPSDAYRSIREKLEVLARSAAVGG